MKRNDKKLSRRPRSLQARDLAAVRGGDNGLLHMDVIVGGGLPNDNGVIHME